MSKKGKVERQSIGASKHWFIKGVFHTIAMLAASYFVILLGTISTPNILAYILGGLGFGGSEAQSGAVFIVSLCAGIFLTAWIFIGSFVLIRFFAKVYVRNIRRTLSEESNAKIDRLLNYKKES